MGDVLRTGDILGLCARAQINVTTAGPLNLRATHQDMPYRTVFSAVYEFVRYLLTTVGLLRGNSTIKQAVTAPAIA